MSLSERLFLPFLALLFLPKILWASGLEVEHLRAEHRINPVGLETLQPCLSWHIMSGERGVLQTAYQIRTAETEEGLESGLLSWDSGKIPSEDSHLVPYGGTEPESGQRIYWQVRVWDNKENVSGWSPTAFWEMGLLDRSEWKASWIDPATKPAGDGADPCPYLRKEFNLKKKVSRAQLYVTCHGLYEVHLNGERVGDQQFTPGWTSYNKRLQYQVYDVTDQVRAGGNAIGAILSEGWYSGRFGWEGKKHFYGQGTALLLQLKITYSDGTEEYITTDKTWKTGAGPILKSEIYDGEIYDAGLEIPGWDMPGFRDRDWTSCLERDFGYANIVPSEGVPVRITETIKPVEKIITPAGELVFDMGQNLVGWVRFQLSGDKNTEIILLHAEVLDKNGNFYTDNLRSARQEVRYTFKGEGIETFEPHFTFQGFRYVKVTGYPGDISLGDLEARVIHSDMEPTGGFECSDPLVNQLQKNIQWGLRGNFLDIPTDCPQRDERMGWTGDAQVFAPTACFNMNTASFFTKWLRDLAADQREDGSVPRVVPMILEGGGGTGWSDGYAATGWADAAVTVPWALYQSYSDKRILESQYASMKAWVEYMVHHAGERYIFDYGFHFGDWLSFAEYYSLKPQSPDYGYAGAHTDKDLIATAYFYHSTNLLMKTASILGKDEDAKRYSDMLPKIKAAFQKEFMTPTGRLSSDTQTAYSLALQFDLLPEKLRQSAADFLAGDVENLLHLTTGFLGTPLICHALSENGYPETAYYLLFQDRYPSWLFPVTMGATTIWERWDGIKPDSTFQTVGMNSFNHYAYGAIGEWIYKNVAGIRSDPDHPGYKKIIIKPLLNSRLDHAGAWHMSPYGKIESGWKAGDEELVLNVCVPPNTTARIYIPAAAGSRVSESGVSLEQAEGISGTEQKGEYLIVEAGSGTYLFTSKPDKSD